MGGVVNTISDIVGGAGDVVGDVIGGAGDIVGSVVDNLNPATIAAIAYMASTGDPSALLAEAGSEEAAATILTNLGDAGVSDILANYSPEIGTTFADNVTSSSLLDNLQNFNGDIAFDGPTIPTDIPYDGPTIPTDLPYDGPTIPADIPYDGPTLPSTPSGGIMNSIKGLIGQLTPSSATVSNIFDSLSKAAPIAGAGLLGKLAYSDQARINQSITQAYNDYLQQQQGIRSGYGVTTGPQQLNYTMSGIPLARAPMRTAADVVNIPKAATGGSINDLFDEYSMLNNRMRNYRRLARGGLI
jgi:hypothetical protein